MTTYAKMKLGSYVHLNLFMDVLDWSAMSLVELKPKYKFSYSVAASSFGLKSLHYYIVVSGWLITRLRGIYHSLPILTASDWTSLDVAILYVIWCGDWYDQTLKIDWSTQHLCETFPVVDCCREELSIIKIVYMCVSLREQLNSYLFFDVF